MEALYSPHQDGFALPQWNNASCEKPLILPAYFGALSLHKYNHSLLRFHRPQEVGIILPQVFINKTVWFQFKRR